MLAWEVEVQAGAARQTVRFYGWPWTFRRVFLSRGYTVVRAKPLILESLRGSGRGLTTAGLVRLFRVLAAYYEVGLPVQTICKLLPHSFKGGERRVVERLADALLDTGNVTTAFERAGVPSHVVETVRAVALSGDLPAGFRSVADVLDRIAKGESAMGRILTYPKWVVVALVWITYGVMVFAVPRIAELVRSLADASGGRYSVPAVTEAAFKVGSVFAAHPFLAAAGCAAVAVLFWKFVSGRMVFELLAKAGVTRRALLNLERVKFYGFLSMFLQIGVVVTRALLYAGNVLVYSKFREAVEAVRRQVDLGMPLSQAMRSAGFFTEEEVGFVESGENTGDVGRFAKQYAQIASERYEEDVATVTNLLPVVALAVVAGYMLGMAVVLLLPVYDAALNAM